MNKRIVPRDYTRYLLPMHPVVFISTVDNKGVDNIGVFATCVDISYQPPVILFASNKVQHRLLGEGKQSSEVEQDTCRNIRKSKKFIVNVPGISLINQMNIIARPFAPEIDEFERSGLKKLMPFVSSPGFKPKIISECLAHLECDLIQIINNELSDHYIILGEVKCASIDEVLGISLEDIRNNLTRSVFGNLRATTNGQRCIGQITPRNIDSIIFSTDSQVFNNSPKIPYQEPLFTTNV